MFAIPYLSNETVEFLTECTYGDQWREISALPEKYQWLKSLMRVEGHKIATELSERNLAVVTNDGRVFVNLTKLPNLKYLLERMERR